MLVCRNIGVVFDGVPALREVPFDLTPGEIHGVVGCNGAGKSTLMKVLAGAVPIDTGEMTLDGQPLRLDAPRTALRHGIAMVYQELSGIGSLSVTENLFLGQHLRTPLGTVAWRRMHTRAKAALLELGIDIDVRQPLGEFPLVVRQMVEIARGLERGARILILDEPTSALSAPEAERLLNVMRSLKSRGMAIVFISHFLEDVLAVCDRVTVLRDGRHVSTQVAGELTRAALLEQMVGPASPAAGQVATETVLNASTSATFRLRIDGFTRGNQFRDVMLKVRAGECLGLYGFAGAGHQELLHAIAGALPIDDGEVRLDQKLIRVRRVADAVRAGVVLVAADRSQTVVRGASLAANLTLAHLSQVVGGWITSQRERRVCQPRLQEIGCRPADPHLLAGQLSGGNQQKVVLGRWLLGPIRVLLLEEPTRGMDVRAKEEVMQLVRKQQAAGVSVILASTEPELLLTCADRIMTFHLGRITQEFSSGRVTKSDLMHAAEREPDDDV